MNEIMRLENIRKVYKRRFSTGGGNIVAVDNLTLSLRKGQTLGIVGESGSGKSTLAKIMTAIETPTSGKVEYFGQALSTMNAEQKKTYRREVQIVFQDSSSSLNPRKTIGWLLKEPLEIHKVSQDQISHQDRVLTMLKEVGLDESYLERYPRELSGGQRQRINIALALILEPTVVIADEPVSALDVSVQAQILNLLEKLQAEHDLTYVFISHDLGVVYYMSDHILVMKDGKIIEHGNSDNIFYHAKEPYTKALFAAKNYTSNDYKN